MTNELEALGEALMALSAQLHRLDTLADARAHEAYERVVDRFNRAWTAIADQSPKGRDAQRLDAKHASGGGEANRPASSGIAHPSSEHPNDLL